MRIAAICLGIALLAAPALADVRTGVEAWNRKDYATAVAQWRGPATAGDADAQYNLGQAYRRGLGVPQDEKLAQDWYRKAADKGHVQAQASLALILFQSPQRAQAFPLLEKASAKGEARAQYVLGTALFNGDGIAKDWPRAYALMRRSSLGGLDAATQSLRQMETYMSPEDRQKGDALLRAFAGMATAAADGTAPSPTAKSPAAPVRTAALTRPASPVSDAVDTKPSDSGSRKTEAAKTGSAKKESAKTDAGKNQAAKKDASLVKAKGPPEPQWKVQLGAFGKMDAARAHWKTLTKKPALAALKPNFVSRDGMVRVQAGPLANRAAAQRACAAAEAAGSACFALQP